MINIKSDSRKVKKGDIFVALKGINSDGDKYIEDAILNGASKIIVEKSNNNSYDIETVKVSDTREYLYKYLYDNYNKYLNQMNIIGITGTNGKTTSCYLIYQALNKLNIKCAYIGTIGYYLEQKKCSLPNTSPDICDLYDMIINAYDQGYRNVVMEVSSQGLDMGRLNTIKFDYAIFTNLTQDHLDYHKTMENYAKAKRKLFDSLKSNGVSIINNDDAYAKYFKTKNNIYYGETANNFSLLNINLGYKSSFDMIINNQKVSFETNLIGKYNIYNLMCCITLLSVMNININMIVDVVKKLVSPPGRMDIIKYNNNLIIIDYAHTPDAMENIYKTINEIKTGNIYTVFGCTGDRDRDKRPIMMSLALKNSKYTIVTSDDLHNEDFNQIISDMTSNLISHDFSIVMDRKKAIQKSIDLLKDKDILLVLGKGHEQFIIVGNNKIPFNDRSVIEELLKNKINM